MKLLSFVIPCYRSQYTINKVIEEIIETVSQRSEYDYEIICVNDCSPDDVYSVLCELAKNNYKIKVINFAKNMGKHAAVLAGHAVVKGDYIIDLDDDYQSPTYNVWSLLEPLESDECDVSTAHYFKKEESLFKRIGSNLNAYMGEQLFDKQHGLRFENFLAMKRFVSDEIIRYKNPYPYLEGLILGATTRIKMVDMEQRRRGDELKSGFTLFKSIKLLANGMTAFSSKPLRVSSYLGFAFSIIGFVWGLILVVKKIINPEILIGYTSTTVIILISTGVILYMLGMIGEYIGRIYICINESPQYVIKNTINLKQNDNNINIE